MRGADESGAVVIAPEGSEVGLLPADEREQRQAHALTHQPDRGQYTLRTKDRCSDGQRRLAADTVEHGIDGCAAGETLQFALDFGRRLATGVDGVVRAVLLGDSELVLAAREADNRRSRPEQLAYWTA